MLPTITVTESALIYIKNRIQKDSAIGFRLAIKKTGCSGNAYVPTIIDTINPKDVKIEMRDGVNIYLDVESLPLLQEVCIDYIEENISGLKQKRLVFSNLKEKGRCGCGESFHV